MTNEKEVTEKVARIIDQGVADKKAQMAKNHLSTVCNSTGLQLADLIARPIGRKLLKPEQQNRAFEIINTKFRRDSSGEVKGWGLKLFP